MQTDQAQIDAANLNINYCRIVAPVGGRVGLRQVDEGNYAQVTDPNGIVVITQIQPISVIFVVPEDNLQQIAARMKDGATLPVTVFDRANVKQLATGTLTTFDNQIDTDHRHFQAAGDFRQRRRRAVSQPVRQRAPARRYAVGRRRSCPTPRCSSAPTAISPMS